MYGFGLLVGLLLAAGAAGAWWLESRPRIPSNLKGIANAEPVIGWALTEGLIGEPIGTAQSGSTQVNVLSVLADSLRTVLVIQVEGVQPGEYRVGSLRQREDWRWWYQSYGVIQRYPTGVFFVYESGGPPPSRRDPLRLTMVVHDQPLVVEIPADGVLHLPEEHWAPARQVTVAGVTVELVRVIQTPAELKVQFRSVLDPAYGTESPQPELIRLADGTEMEGAWMARGAVSSVRFRRPRGNRLPALTIGEFRWYTDEIFFPLEAGTTQMVGPERVTLTQGARSDRKYEVLFAWPDSSPLRTLGVRVVDSTTRKTLDPIGADEYNRVSLGGKYYFVPSRIDPAQAQIGVVGSITLQGRWELPMHR